jgi:arsenate reductase (glutaredoxin)
MTITLYGIPNCDTMKKARHWLDSQGLAYEFHNYKDAGIDRAHLERWCHELGWDAVLNRNGLTFRNLAAADKEGLDAAKAITLMLAYPSMIKRPVLETSGRVLAGFKPQVYADELKR